MGVLLISHILNIACHRIRILANKILEAVANFMVLVDNLFNSDNSLASAPNRLSNNHKKWVSSHKD